MVSGSSFSVVFIHLFKCSGTGFIRVAQQNYRSNNYEQKYRWDMTLKHPRAWDNLTQETKNKFRFYCGHFVDGKSFDFIHNIANKPYVLVTVLRDPVDRLISSYFFIRQEKSRRHVLHSFAKKVSFEDFLDRDVINDCLDSQLRQTAFELLHNYQTRILSGTSHYLKWDFPESSISNFDSISISNTHLEIAKSNLDNYFSFVGLQENLDESWKTLVPRLFWKKVDSHFFRLDKRVNRSENRFSSDNISLIAKDRILKENSVDYQLYDFTCINQDDINTRPLVIINENSSRPTSL